MSIKIIFGENGAGKTLFKKQMINAGNIGLDSSISDWEIGNSGEFSHYKTLETEYLRQIKLQEDKFFSDDSSALKNVDANSSAKKKMLQNLKALYSEIDFQNFEKWKKFNDSLKQDYSLQSEMILGAAIDLYELIRKNNLLATATIEQFNAAILLLQLKLKDEDFNGVVLEKLKQLEVIEQDLKNFIGNDELLFQLKKLNLSTLKKLRTNPNNKLVKDEVIDSIKLFAINSDEYLEIEKIILAKDAKLKSAIIFDTSIDGVSEDGKSIIVNSYLSDGEKVVRVLIPVIKSQNLKNNEVYLDDVYEKLDSKNIDLLSREISNMGDTSKVTILTHNEYTFEQICDVFDAEGINVEFQEIELKNDGGSLPIAIAKASSKVALVFEKLNCNLVKDFNPLKHSNSILFFSRLLGRNNNKAGSVSNVDSGLSLNSTSNFLMYEFTSENIKHYEKSVDINKFNKLFGTSINTSISLDSIGLICEIKKIIPAIGNDFGIDFAKVQSYLDDLISILSEEKKIWNVNHPKVGQSKSKFAKEHWGKSGQSITWQDRNEIAHKLDNSLVYVLKR